MNTLDRYRKTVDQIDRKLLLLFAKRFALVKKIGKQKKEEGLPITDKKREEAVIQKLLMKDKEQGLRETFIKTVWHIIFQESYTAQKES